MKIEYWDTNVERIDSNTGRENRIEEGMHHSTYLGEEEEEVVEEEGEEEEGEEKEVEANK